MARQGKLFIVSAPSGAGKTTLVTIAIERLSSECPIERVVTYTTKRPRQGDMSGKDYYFITVADFKEKIVQGFFIEWSTSYGCYYGSPRHKLDEIAQGTSLILVIDRTGARQVCAQIQHAILIWIYTKDIAILQERLTSRATENLEQMHYRLTLAYKELEEEAHEKLYHYHILNDDFESALQELELIVLGSLEKSV